jgi:hypothetical protein
MRLDLKFRYDGRAHVMTLPWLRPMSYFLLILFLALTGFAVGLHYFTLGLDSVPQERQVIVFGLMYLTCLVLFYFSLLTLFNRTEIRIGAGKLRTWSGPVPCWGNRALTLSEVTRVYLDTELIKTKRGVEHSYDVKAQMADGRTVGLLAFSLPKSDVETIANEIQRVLENR